MTSTSDDDPGAARAPTPRRQALRSRSDFESAAEQVLLGLPDSGVREAWLVDPDLAVWPLGSAAMIDALTRWIRQPGRRLHLVAADFEPLARRHPRLASWRVTWAHGVNCLSPQDLDAGDLPALLLAGRQRVQLLDREHWRGVWTDDPRDALMAAEQIEAISQRSAPSWPAHTLGL